MIINIENILLALALIAFGIGIGAIIGITAMSNYFNNLRSGSNNEQSKVGIPFKAAKNKKELKDIEIPSFMNKK